MDKYLMNAFDELTAEELESIVPEGDMHFELPGETILRMQEHALQKLRAAHAEAVTQPRSRIRRLSKTLLIAAVVVVLLAASVLAYRLGGGRFLEEAFGGSNYDLVKEYVMSDVDRATDGTLTLTLESALTDGHSYYAVFSVAREDGGSMAGMLPDVSFEFELTEPSRIRPGFQIEKLDTEENSESCTYYIALIRSKNAPIASMSMSLTRLIAFEPGRAEVAADLTVKADFLPCPAAVGGSETGVFRSIALSPFGLWIDVCESWAGGELSEGRPIHDVYLRYKGGETVGAEAARFADGDYMESIGWGAEQVPNGNDRSYISIRFTRFVEVDRVEAVILDGDEYPLRLETPEK